MWTYASSTASSAAFSILYFPPLLLALETGVTKLWKSDLVSEVGSAGTSAPVCGEILVGMCVRADTCQLQSAIDHRLAGAPTLT